MAYLATNRFPGDGSTTTYEINFVGKYLSREDVYAYREDNETRARFPVSISPGQFINDTTIGGFAPTPPTQTLVIYRSTRKQPLVDFVNGARLSEFNLDLATRQGLFIAMEAIDAASPDTVNALLEAVAVVQGLVGDAQSAALAALQAVVDAQTAANAAIAAGADALDAQLAAEAANTAAQTVLVSTITARDAAYGSAQAAANSASSASGSASAASTSAGTAAGHATAASTSATSANSSRILAENAAQAASSSQSAASGSASAASSSASAASASATAAAGSATSASGSATSASQAASNAASSASAASTSASTASTKAGEASASASSASTSATNAGSSATAAANSASAALVYANAASNSAVNAEDAKIAAANSASSASSSANAASASATTASTAAAQASSWGGMHCRLILQDAGFRTVKLERCGGSTLMINSTVRLIPESGVTVSLPNSGTIHHLYVSWASNTMSLTYSTTAPTYVPSRGQWTDPASWDKVYVGSVRPNAMSEPRRFLRSMYNGMGAIAHAGFPTGDTAMTWNGAPVQLVYMPFLLLPGDVIVVEGASNIISDPNDRVGELQLRVGGATIAVSRNTHSGSNYSWRSYYRSYTISRGELDAPAQADFELFYYPASASGGNLTVNGGIGNTALTVTVHPYRW